MLSETGRHQRNKDPRLKETTTSEEGEDIWRDLQADPGARDCKENNWTARIKKMSVRTLWRGSAPSEIKKRLA
jgi:hypothetical protein